MNFYFFVSQIVSVNKMLKMDYHRVESLAIVFIIYRCNFHAPPCFVNCIIVNQKMGKHDLRFLESNKVYGNFE